MIWFYNLILIFYYTLQDILPSGQLDLMNAEIY